jgi:hypothetical protein
VQHRMRGKELVQFRLAPIELHPQRRKILFSIAEIAVIAEHPKLPRASLQQKIQIAIHFGDNSFLRLLSELLQVRPVLIEIRLGCSYFANPLCHKLGCRCRSCITRPPYFLQTQHQREKLHFNIAQPNDSSQTGTTLL